MMNRLFFQRSLFGRFHLNLFVMFFMVLLVGVSISLSAIAQDEGLMNRLFAPGPLTRGHDQLEGPSDCKKCHESGKGVTDSKCLECHKELGSSIEAKLGYHGLISEACSKCHSDHKGREFESAHFDSKTFDHGKTGYKLTGKHHDLKCQECHKEKRGAKRNRPLEIKFFGAANSCKVCHQKQDIHFFQGEWAKKDCGACHGLNKWDEDLKFEHKRDTKFSLEGFHGFLECQECHNPTSLAQKKVIYKWPKLATSQCLSCHENFHRENLSPKFQNGKCQSCHNQEDWKIRKFDHQLTHYPLRGKHAEIDCLDCHLNAKLKAKTTLDARTAPTKKFAELKNPNIKWTGLGKQCLSCHEDFHRFGHYKSPTKTKYENCLSCHNESNWKKLHDYSHAASTRYIIDGEHRKLKCSDCHLAQNKKPILKPNPGIYVWPKLLDKTCENCHKNPHLEKFSKKMLQQKCTECHVTDGWQVVKTGKDFDHNKTKFSLTGKHIKATCTQCHVKNKVQVFHWTSPDQGYCVECHQNVHKEQFHDKFNSQSCLECHDTNTWSKRKAFDHNTAAYLLAGAHTKVECSVCHTVTPELFPIKPLKHMSLFKFPGFEKDKCLACHKDVHAGQLGNDCTKCHNDNSWKNTKFNHQTQSKYPLLGKHAEAKCVKCHKPRGQDAGQEKVIDFKKVVTVLQYKPLTVQCGGCHKDIHKGHFGAQCASCHSEQAWKTTKDFHKDYSLVGVHFTLQCTECHGQNRKLAGLSRECIFCHKKDDVHSGTLADCEKCHLQVYWENSKFRHSMTTFPLKGAHRTLHCQDCHQRGVYQGLSSECISCHLSTYQGATTPVSHAGFSTTCTQCHHSPFRW